MIKNFIALFTVLLIVSCTNKGLIKTEEPNETYISPCLFLNINNCPNEMKLLESDRGHIKVKGTESEKIISLDVEDFHVSFEYNKAKQILQALSKTITHEHLGLLESRLDSLDFGSKQEIVVEGILKTDILNWIFLEMLKSGDFSISTIESNENISGIQCAGYRKHSDTKLVEGADFWVPHKGHLFRTMLNTTSKKTNTYLPPADELEAIYSGRLHDLEIEKADVDMSLVKGEWKGIRQISFRPENKVQWDKELFQELTVFDDSCKFIFFGDMEIHHSTSMQGRFVISRKMITKQSNMDDIIEDKIKVLLYVVKIDEKELKTVVIDKGNYAHITTYEKKDD